MVVTTKDYDALLLAMVDAVLAEARRESTAHWRALLAANALSPEARNAGAYARQMSQHLGWWRSTW